MISLEAVYSDETRRRVHVESVHLLRHQDISMLVVHTATKSYRIHGDGFYVFGYRLPDDWFCAGWDQDDGGMWVYSEAEPNGAVFGSKRDRTSRFRTDHYPEDFIMARFTGRVPDADKLTRIIQSSDGVLLSRTRLRGDR